MVANDAMELARMCARAADDAKAEMCGCTTCAACLP